MPGVPLTGVVAARSSHRHGPHDLPCEVSAAARDADPGKVVRGLAPEVVLHGCPLRPVCPVAAAPAQRQLRVRLIMLVLNVFPSWWPFLLQSYKINQPAIELLVVHSNVSRPAGMDDAHVRYELLQKSDLLALFARQLGIGEASVAAKFASGKGLSDLKPFYGKVFEQWLPEPSAAGGCCSHWGWVDWDLMLGDVLSVVPPPLLWEWEAVTFPGATLGFAWAGQLSIFHNTRETREMLAEELFPRP